jgi:hypothetical protein
VNALFKLYPKLSAKPLNNVVFKTKPAHSDFEARVVFDGFFVDFGMHAEEGKVEGNIIFRIGDTLIENKIVEGFDYAFENGKMEFVKDEGLNKEEQREHNSTIIKYM